MEPNAGTDRREELMEILRDLVRIHDERIQGFEDSMIEAHDDSELLAVFTGLIIQSREFKQDLLMVIEQAGETLDAGNLNTGKIYRIWMYLKTSMALSSRRAKTVLDLCEFSEDALQKAYGKALESPAISDAELQAVIMGQKALLKESHDLIRKYSDEFSLVDR